MSITISSSREALAHADRVRDQVAVGDLGARGSLEAVLQRRRRACRPPSRPGTARTRGPRGRSRRRTRRRRGTPARCARRGAGRTPRRPFLPSPRRGTRGGPCPGARSSRDADTTDGSTIWWMVKSDQLGDVRMGRGEHAPPMTVIEVDNLHKRYGDTVAVAGRVLRRRGGRDLRHPRPERRRQDHHRRVRRRAAHAATAGTIRVLGPRPRATAPSCAQLVGVQLQESQLPEKMTRRRGARALRVLLPRAGRLAASSPATLGLDAKLEPPRSASCPAARSSGSRSRSRWSATRGSPSSTS